LSAGQINFLKRREERESKEKLDAWHLNQTNPALAKAKRVKGIINNKEAWHQRRKQFPTYFAQWPNTLTAEELRLKIFVWLSHQRLQKWRGVKKHYLKTTASVRKKLTELNVYRYNFRLRVWFKCGSVEEAETTRRQAEQEAERRRLAHKEAERIEEEKWRAHWKEQEEVKRLKAEAEQAEAERLNRPIDWSQLTPIEAERVLEWGRGSWGMPRDKGLEALPMSIVRYTNRKGLSALLDVVERWHASICLRTAEAVLLAD